MTESPEMLTWYLAQLLQDELAAREGGFDSWHTKECGNDQNSALFGDCSCDVKDQVLADIAVKRLLVEYHFEAHECCGPDDNCMWINADEVCPTVRALVSAFAGRPGYLPEWNV